MAALCWFVEEGTFAAWVLAIVLLREFAVSGMRLVAVEKGASSPPAGRARSRPPAPWCASA